MSDAILDLAYTQSAFDVMHFPAGLAHNLPEALNDADGGKALAQPVDGESACGGLP